MAATIRRPTARACAITSMSLTLVEAISEHEGLLTVNLGTRRNYSVLEMVRSFQKASGRAVPYSIVARRPGDIAACYADPALAEKLLGWKASLGIDDMCRDAWRWQQKQ